MARIGASDPGGPAPIASHFMAAAYTAAAVSNGTPQAIFFGTAR
jgi:hypothetical protein